MTNPERSRWSDHDVEQAIGRLLQVGVMIAALVVVVGGVAMLSQYGHALARFQHYQDVPSPLWSLHGIGRGLMTGDSRSIVQFGLVLLILTPVARVTFTLGAFILQRDRLYIAITSVVLSLLLYGLVWSRG